MTLPTACLWTPGYDESEKLHCFRRQASGKKVLYTRERDKFVSFVLSGRNPPDSVIGRRTYFLRISGSLMHDRVRVRRTVRVYPWDTALPDGLPQVSLKDLLQPILLREAWEAAGRPVSVIRTYPSGGEDRVKRMPGGRHYSLLLSRSDLRSAIPDDPVEPFFLEKRADVFAVRLAADLAIDLPDWRLTGALRDARRSS